MKDNLDLQVATRLWGPIETEAHRDAADLWGQLDSRDLDEAAKLFPLGTGPASEIRAPRRRPRPRVQRPRGEF